MKNKNNDEMNLNNYIQIILNNRWILIACLLGVLLPIIYYNSKATPIYQSSTLILFDRQASQFSINNSFPFRNDKSFIANQIEEIKSKSLADDVANELSKQYIDKFSYPKETPKYFNKIKYISSKIHGNISAKPIQNSDIIEIKVKAPDPELAMLIGNTITNVLEKRSLLIKREETSNAIKMIRGQLERYKSKLDGAEIALKNYKEKNKISISPDQESIQIFQRITNAEVLLNETKSNRESTESRLKYIKEKIKKQRKDLVPNITQVTSPWVQKLKESLVDLEIQYTTLKVKNYAKNHPKMIQLRNKIEQTKENLKRETMKLAQGENIIDPISQMEKFLEETISLDIEIQTYKAQEAALHKIIDNYNFSLKSVPEKELELSRLIRNKNVNEQLYTMLLQKYEEMKIAQAQKIGNIRVIDPARKPGSPIEPRKALNIILGLFVGMLLGGAWIFVTEFMNDSVKSSEELESLTNRSVLATIPFIRNKDIQKNNGEKRKIKFDKTLISILNPKSPISESFHTLKTNIQFSSLDKPLKKILITSSNPSEGKSTIAANLSIAAAQSGIKTLIIDADFRKPMLHLLFDQKREPGLVNSIISLNEVMKDTEIDSFENNKELNNIINKKIVKNGMPLISKKIDKENSSKSELLNFINQYIFESAENIIRKTGIPNLHLFTSGKIPPNPSYILSSQIFKKIISSLTQNYDLLIFDSPPVLAVSDAILLASICDAVVLTTKADQTKIDDIQKTIQYFERTGSKLLGFAYNQAEKPKAYGYNYKYYYYDDDHNRKKKKSKLLLPWLSGK